MGNARAACAKRGAFSHRESATPSGVRLQALAARLREAHGVCEEHRDIATASLIEGWVDEAERRSWFLFETTRRGDSSGH